MPVKFEEDAEGPRPLSRRAAATGDEGSAGANAENANDPIELLAARLIRRRAKALRDENATENSPETRPTSVTKPTPSERRQRQAWIDAAERLGLDGALGHEIKKGTRRQILARIDGYAAKSPAKRSALAELREFIGERASPAERARKYRERQNPHRAAHRRADCLSCGAPLTGRRVDSRTCSANCRRALSRKLKKLADSTSPWMKAALRRAKRKLRE